MIKRFAVYGFLGWSMEVMWTGVAALLQGDINMVGHSSVWMFFVYGAAVFFLEPLHNRIKNRPWYFRGVIYTVSIFAVEFLSGTLLQTIGIQAWRYSGTFAVAGLIRLDYAPAWFVVGLVFERIHKVLADV